MGESKPEIVGVVGSIRRTSLVSEPWADMYVPFEKVAIPSVTMFVRTTGDPVAALPAVRAAVRRLEPDAVFHGARTMSDIAEESAAATRLASRLLADSQGSRWCSPRSASTA